MNIANRIKEIIIEQLRVNEEDVLPNASFTDDLGADSLDTIEIVMSIEEELNIEIPDHEVEQMETVGSVLNYLTANLSNG
ncbi:MAG: acyl carrier protein [Alteromonas sp.]|nr:MAG: acyl carrier protein [Alteromonas sp.]